MNSQLSPHPDVAHLVRYFDRELSAKEMARVELHLAVCERCHAEEMELRDAAEASDRYYAIDFAAEFPPPQKPWAALDLRRNGPPKQPWRAFFSWGAALSAAASILIAAGYYLEHAPAARAETLLRQATVREHRNDAQSRRIQVRTRRRTLTRPAVLAQQTDSAPELATLFSEARYRWDDPLSASAFAGWRNQLSRKTDEIRESAGLVQVTTRTQERLLTEATIEMRREDLHAVRASFTFQNAGFVEIRELPAAAPIEDATGPITAPRPHAAAEQPLTPPSPATPRDELHVIAALHRIGADLGEPIEVSRTERRILVTATGLTPERQNQLMDALAGNPEVTILFPFGASASSVAPVLPRAQRPSPVEKQLASSRFEEVADRALAESDSIMARAHALRRLAERFPPDVESNLSSDDGRVLQGLRADHALSLSRHVRQLISALKPVVPGIEASVDAPPSARSWQEFTRELFLEADAVDHCLAAVVGATDNAPSPDTAAQLSGALRVLSANAAAYASNAADAVPAN